MYVRGGEDRVCLERGSFFLTKGDWKGGRREANGSKRKTKREHEFDQNAT